MSIGVFLVSMDSTIIASSFAAIGSEFKQLQKASWVVTGYLLTLTSFQPLYGKLSDIFGRKTCLIVAYTVFALGILFCGLARSMNELIAARAIAGIGGGGISTVGSIIMSDVVPLRKRGTWQGLQNIMFAVGSSAGAPLGGVLADTIGWRWSFLIQVPITALAVLTVTLALRLPSQALPSSSNTFLSKLKRIDFLGAFTLIVTIFALLLALDRGSTVSWSSSVAIACFVIAAVFCVLFMIVEWTWASEPLAPKRIMTSGSLVACYSINFFATASMMTMTYQFPLYLQAVRQTSPSMVGVWLLPSVLSGVAGGLIGGFLIQRTGKYHWLNMLSGTVMCLGSILLTLTTGTLVFSTVGIIFGLIISRLGGGAGISSVLVALLANAGREDKATATAVSYLFRSLGSLIGVSLGSTVMQDVLRKSLREYSKGSTDIDELVRSVVGSLSYINELDGKTQAIVRKSYADGVHAAMWLAVGLVACAAVSSVFVKVRPLEKR
ncbi:hypothetical protein SERLA73DRAFT_113391 [Serpula lacrymans var. lacrymans S7.3]|uniref:Major facilitator superfamily (MFS) profile domain-containing protein n=2 Tax=Serpula lacrymans var. lacrymans TaxID=341189 RepID=F8Q809_SERL3|nr:uncharacterized protein SERLADRAFT_357869 [Serpula lacrymans var. lacrymans S7.9]EGN95697.1 hypothetical protein SERLA73DRAFT_113391 [Serpula lacrymans var. lacrymans S7.3]EGO21223.1 hypothetical protein SERLADRAFT_357869 [Serpula lacrymans var. lacrymans S7.9]